MQTRKLIASVLLFGALLFGLVWVVVLAVYWFARPRPQWASLAVERKPLGKCLPPANEPHEVWSALLSDLDGDGQPEVVATYRNPRRSEPLQSCYRSLGSDGVQSLPIFPLTPVVPIREGMWRYPQKDSLPLPRELLGLEPTTNQIVLLAYREGRWQVRTPDALKRERMHNAIWTDTDDDGRHDDALVLIPSRRYAWLELDEQGYWHLRYLDNNLPAGHTRSAHLLSALSSISVAMPGSYSVHGAVFIEQTSVPDVDGDGRPEQIVNNGRRYLRTSRTGQLIPGASSDAVEWFYAAEFDGQPGTDLLHASKSLYSNTLQISLYRNEGGSLRLAAQKRVPVSYIAPVWLKDLDGDGRTEVMVLNSTTFRRAKQLWHLFRYESGGWREQKVEKPLFESMEEDWLSETIDFGSGVGFLGMAPHRPIERLFGWGPRQYLILFGFPSPPNGGDPARWDMLTLGARRIVWAGDYDGDGISEIVADTDYDEEGVWLLQYRADRWHGVQLAQRGALVLAQPVQLEGQPRLLLIYKDGSVEAITIMGK